MLGVLEQGTEIRCLIEETESGLCCEPGDYNLVEKHIRWFLNNAGSSKVVEMGQRGHENLIRNLTREASVKKYVDEILKL